MDAAPAVPTKRGPTLDAEAAYQWLVDVKKISPKRIVSHGESLGGAVALELALRRPVAGLILESSFTSIVDMGKRIFPFLPIDLMVTLRYDSLAKIPRITCPVLVMHSPQDDIVPYDMGQRLFAAAHSSKTFCKMQGGHNEGFLQTGAAYGEAVKNFLKGL